MAFTYADMTEFMGRFGNDIMIEQVNEAGPLYERLPKINKGGRVGIVDVRGAFAAVQGIQDSGTLATGGAVTGVQGTYNPVALLGRLAIPRLIHLADGEGEGIDLMEDQIKAVGSKLGRVRDCLLFSDSVHTVDATSEADFDGSAGAQTTIEMSDVAQIRVGDRLARYETSTAVVDEYLEVTAIDIDPDGIVHTVTVVRNAGPYGLTAGASPTTAAVGDKVRFVGITGAYNFASLEAAAAAADLYGITYTSNGWEATRQAAGGGDFDESELNALFETVGVKRGQDPNLIVSHPRLRRFYGDELVGQRRFMPGQKMDVGRTAKTGERDTDLEFQGQPWMVDPNCPMTLAYALNTDDVAIRVFRDWLDEGDGGPTPHSANSINLIPSGATFDYDAQIWGAFNLHWKRRNGLGLYSGVTTT